MANSIAMIPFSASVQGQGIKIAATGTAGTLVHTTGTSSSIADRIYLWAYCAHTAGVLTTVEFGGPTAPDQNIVVTVPNQAGDLLIVPGFILTGSGSVALTVKVFAATTNVVIVHGYVLRISQP